MQFKSRKWAFLIVRIGHCPPFSIGSHNTSFSLSGSTDLVVFHQWPYPAHSLVMAQCPGVALYVIAAGWKVKMVDVRKEKSIRACKATVEVYTPLPLLPHWAVSSKTRSEAELKAIQLKQLSTLNNSINSKGVQNLALNFTINMFKGQSSYNNSARIQSRTEKQKSPYCALICIFMAWFWLW